MDPKLKTRLLLRSEHRGYIIKKWRMMNVLYGFLAILALFYALMLLLSNSN
jgi:hypothetical protein